MFTSASRTLRAAAAPVALAGVLLGGCAVGPDFHAPAPPRLDTYAAAAPAAPFAADGAAQTLRLGQAVDPSWWRLFGSPELDALVAEGLRASPTLAAARATLRQSQDQARAGAGVFLPAVSASFGAAREHSTPSTVGQPGAGTTFSLFTLAGAVTYAIDLFGGERRGVEALNAQADHDRHAVGAAYLLLTGNLVDTAIARAAYADETRTLADLVALDVAQRDILQAEAKAGHAPLSAALEAEQQLSADRQTLAAARQRLTTATTLLAALIGREPAEAAPKAPDLADFALPADAPVSLPSQLVRRRPDILEAEASLHQASAQLGVATAALFPSITLTGDYGAAGAALGKLSQPAGRFWSIGPSLDVPIFRGGALWFGRRAAQEAYLRAQSDYRQTVLAALEQVADQLAVLGADAETADAARAGFDAAALNRTLAAANRQAGVIADYDAMTLAAEADRARLGLIAARAQRLQDVVGLYVASGGGWTATGSGVAR